MIGKEWNTYVFAYYWIFEVITTVGYGDYTGSTSEEYLFTLMLEFVGVSINAIFLAKMGSFFNSEIGFDILIEQRLAMLDIWIKKIEKSNKPLHINSQLYKSIGGYIRDAFLFDFNLIVEEFNFHQKLPPKDQTALIEQIFGDFIKKFDHFFGPCEIGFKNEFVI